METAREIILDRMRIPNIPSAVTIAEARELRELARDRNVLEVGALLGFSTIVMADVANRVVSVDPHEGYPVKSPRSTLAPFLNNIRNYGVEDRVTPMIGTHDKVFPHLLVRSFDLVFIDGTGDRTQTLDIMCKALPLLRHYAVMAVHDCGHPDWPGVTEALALFGRRYTTVDRLAVMTGVWNNNNTR